MFNFEHELRAILLKNTLIIEENIKRIFISTLNDEEHMDSDYLANISNYNVKATGFTKPLESLSKIIKLQGNTNSKPIKRKRNQEIIVPYWILINEMTLNQTITTIKNLNETIKYKILQRCINEFTLLNINIFDSNKDNMTIVAEKKNIHIFTKILTYVGYFRNMLAHNQPIYNYNVKDIDLTSFPSISYNEPNINGVNNVEDQYRQNAATMLKLQEFYERDFFNGRNYKVNIDLSWIIYVISKIINRIDSKSDFGEEIRSVYKKYNILICYNESTIVDMKSLIDLKLNVLEINVDNLNANSLIELIDNNKAYKARLKSEIAYLKNKINEIKKEVGDIKIVRKKSEYKPFTNINEYKKYTNIDSRFLMSI